MIIKDISDKSLPAGADKPDEYTLVPLSATETLKLGRSVRKKGESTPEASHHDEEEFYIILKGSGVIESAGRQYPIQAMQIAYIARNEPHKITCLSDEPLEYLYIGNWPGLKPGEIPATA